MFGGYLVPKRLTASGAIHGSAVPIVVYKMTLVATSTAVAPLEAHLRANAGATDDAVITIDAKNKSQSEYFPEGIHYATDGYVNMPGTNCEVYVYYRTR